MPRLNANEGGKPSKSFRYFGFCHLPFRIGSFPFESPSRYKSSQKVKPPPKRYNRMEYQKENLHVISLVPSVARFIYRPKLLLLLLFLFEDFYARLKIIFEFCSILKAMKRERTLENNGVCIFKAFSSKFFIHSFRQSVDQPNANKRIQ